MVTADSVCLHLSAASRLHSTRKFFTILFSVFLHGHHLNAVQWASVAAVFAGLGFEVFEKYQARKHKGYKQKHTA